MARLYEATIRYRVYQEEDEHFDPEEDALWSSGGSLAKALENYAAISEGPISVESATVVALGVVEDED